MLFFQNEKGQLQKDISLLIRFSRISRRIEHLTVQQVVVTRDARKIECLECWENVQNKEPVVGQIIDWIPMQS